MATAEPLDRKHASRRAFLRGAGITLALPWLESLPLRAAESGKRISAQNQNAPTRFACIYFSNGVEPTHWWAKGSGANMELGPGLKPMQPFAEDMVFLRGLFNEQARAHKSAHLGRIPNLLSGGWVSTDQNDIRCGRTMDQVLAKEIGDKTRVKESRFGHRTDRTSTRRWSFDALRIVHFMDLRIQADNERDISVPSVRSSRRRR